MAQSVQPILPDGVPGSIVLEKEIGFGHLGQKNIVIVIIDLDPSDSLNRRFLVCGTLGKQGLESKAGQIIPQWPARNPFFECTIANRFLNRFR